MAFNLKGAVVVWPWYVGTHVAVQFGAADPSLSRTITGWVFEAPWLAFLGFAVYVYRKRSAGRKRVSEQERIAAKARAEAGDNTAQGLEKTDTATTTVRCPNCQHAQAVPRSQPTFVCEGCNAHLKCCTAPADGG
jgi:hypothetical protein